MKGEWKMEEWTEGPENKEKKGKKKRWKTQNEMEIISYLHRIYPGTDDGYQNVAKNYIPLAYFQNVSPTPRGRVIIFSPIDRILLDSAV